MTNRRTKKRAIATLAAATLALLVSGASRAQAPAPKKSAPVGSTAAPRVTAGKDMFVDVTRASGVDFRITCGSKEKLYIVETQCGGAAAFDFDNDGWMDILLIDGSTVEDFRAGKCHPPRLYRNQHDGTFLDVSARAGLNFCGWGYGVAIGDFDNDGWSDVFISGFHGSALYRNNHDGTFSDVTARAGVANADRWGTSAAFGDYDNDGKLDLYVANYVELDINDLPKFGEGPFCQYRGLPVNCGPRGLKGDRDRLFHNNGDGTFTDVTEKLGLDPGAYYGLGVLWLDYDKDGCLDLYVANDSSPSLLYHNDCKGGFSEVGAEAGVAYSSDGREQAGMGIDADDYDRDGWPDIVKTNFSDDSNNLYHNDHNGEFTDRAGAAGIAAISIPYLAFGAKFLDFDNDGWPDLFIANGHVDPQVEGQSFGVGYAERPFLFHNLGEGRFEEIGERSGAALRQKYVGRAALTADFWNRGRQDLLMTTVDGSPVLLRNETAASGHWLRIRTIGTKSNRDGYGARVEVTVGGKVRYAEVRSGASFESASDPRLHFGLGTATRIDSIVIRWPGGQVDKIGPEPADQLITIQEGRGKISATTIPATTGAHFNVAHSAP